MKPSAEIRRDIDLLVSFRTKFIELINSSTRADSDWASVELKPKGSQKEWMRLHSEVAHAAGAAQYAYNRQGGGTVSFRNAAYLMNNVNPVANWKMSLASPDTIEPTVITSSVEAAIGAATVEYEAALQRERGLVGLIAAFVRWPQTLREAVGDGRAPRATAGAIGVLGQILVGTLSGALAVGLVSLVVWLSSQWFGGSTSPPPAP